MHAKLISCLAELHKCYIAPVPAFRLPNILSYLTWPNIKNALSECWHTLLRLNTLPLPDAFRRLGLILFASMMLVVLITTIDSAYLSLYVALARR